MTTNRTGKFLALPALVFSSLLFLAGCDSSSGGGKNGVSGKVTLDGKAVAGSVIFVGSDGKEVPVLIKTDGTYSVDLPSGKYKVAVRSLGMPTIGTGKVAAAGTSAGDTGAFAPVKYNAVDNGMSFDHAGGKQTHNIELKP